MLIILDVEIYCVEYEGNIGIFQKEVDSNISPSLGIKVIDRTFEGEARKVEEIVINFEEDRCFIKLEPQRIDKEEHLKMYKTMYEPNGWKWCG